MTRMTTATPQTKTNQQRTASNTQRKQAQQSNTIDQYAINHGACTMNFFGAGSLKMDW